jgi:hypothetical protein
MRREPTPVEVAARLAELGRIFVPETIREGRERLRRDAMSPEAIASTVHSRLEELRALDELSRYLHRRR